MNAVFAWLGIDYGQWRAVSRTLLRGDIRPPLPQNTGDYSLRRAGGWLALFGVYGLIGITAAIVIALSPDVLLTGVVTLSYLSFLLATALLSQHGAALFDASDRVLLGSRPIGSRTLLAIRLTNVLFHAWLLTTAMAYPPVIAYAAAHGGGLTRALAAMVALYGCATAVTFALLAGYAALLRVISPARLQRAIGYTQMAVGLLAYGGIVLVLEVVGRAALMRAELPRGAWLYAVPPAWFASFIELAAGAGGADVWARAGLAVAATGGLGVLLVRRLGGGYAERLEEIATRADAPAPPARRAAAWLFAEREARAVSLLVLAHFRHDTRVRMGVLGILPLAVLYVVFDLRDRGTGDPFGGVAGGGGLLELAALIFPAILTGQLGASQHHRASWIYDATPARHGELMIALVRVAAVYFLAPFVLVMAALFAWRFDHPGHAVLHAALIGAISMAALQTSMIVAPQLPFARPPQKMTSSAALFAWMILVLVGGQLLLLAMRVWIYEAWWRVIGFAVLLLAVLWILGRVLRWRMGQT